MPRRGPLPPESFKERATKILYLERVHEERPTKDKSPFWDAYMDNGVVFRVPQKHAVKLLGKYNQAAELPKDAPIGFRFTAPPQTKPLEFFDKWDLRHKKVYHLVDGGIVYPDGNVRILMQSGRGCVINIKDLPYFLDRRGQEADIPYPHGVFQARMKDGSVREED